MCRAERKLQLSYNVIGDDIADQEGKEMAGAEDGDLRSVIFGLHKLDPTEMSNEKSDKITDTELTAMAEKVVSFRYKLQSESDDRKFVVNPADLLHGQNILTQGGAESISDPDLDEASYRMWVEKFKETSPSNHYSIIEVGNRRGLPEDKHLKAQAARKKAEQKKLSKWEALGYNSLAIVDPVTPTEGDMLSDSGSVNFVYGDCTDPSRVSASEPTLIFR